MNAIDTIFNSLDGRVRAGWRLLLQIVLSFIFLIPLQLLAGAIGGTQLQIIAGGIAITMGVWVAGLILDKRPIRDFGLNMNAQWWREFGIGFALAAVVMTLIAGIQLAAGWIEFSGFGWERASSRNFLVVLGAYILTMAVVGFYEELWTRGYQLKNLTEGFCYGGKRNRAGIIAIALTSILFGVLHLGNPNASMMGMIVIMLAGVALAIPYVVTGQLGMSVGLHFAWNVVQGGFYGLPVSGIPFRQSVLQFDMMGPELWTGGRFGPEGGLLGLFGVLLMLAMTVAVLYRKGYSMSVSPEITRPPSDRYT
ncbi:CPBP family intramembrane glutamic endopeptidase [Natronogracilivirga saccharolytica]|uniref:CPBP family intramembrane metalloprotease n=1 Tax=Natronogracilivirga saccharolytica TaxID=2812953 RepID=A0A8J7RP23_9BACT|nr:type II CAAX endopeptidase family protein [Natronogracilivirga saccharolytica]MBP3193563.1 CPBP family intramembrane metalloprotease [Natronogracilivirga saccharolytica]